MAGPPTRWVSNKVRYVWRTSTLLRSSKFMYLHREVKRRLERQGRGACARFQDGLGDTATCENGMYSSLRPSALALSCEAEVRKRRVVWLLRTNLTIVRASAMRAVGTLGCLVLRGALWTHSAAHFWATDRWQATVPVCVRPI